MKKITLILLCLISLSAWSQDEMDSVAQRQKWLLDTIAFTNKQFKTTEGQVSEIQQLHSGKIKKCNGNVYYSAPNLLSMLFTNNDKIIVSGDKIFLDHGMFHGTYSDRHKLMRGLKNTLLCAFQGKCQQLADDCDFNISVKEEKNEYVVTLTAKKKVLLGFNHIVLHYSTDFRLKKFEYTASNGDHSIYTLSNLKYDVKLNKDVFKFN